MPHWPALVLCTLLPVFAAAQTPSGATMPDGTCDLVSAASPETVLQVAKRYGGKTLGKDRNGDPMISGTLNGIKYQILFVGCTDHSECESLQLVAGWSDVKAGMVKINHWNRGKRYGKAFLDDKNDPILVMDINLAFGVPRKNLDDTLDYWGMVMEAFNKEVIGD